MKFNFSIGNIAAGNAMILVLAGVFILSSPSVSGQKIASAFDALAAQDVDITSDSIEFIGNNALGEGNVKLWYKDMMVEADKVIVNFATKDLEAVGNINFIRRVKDTEEVTADQLARMRQNPEQMVEVVGYVVKSTGRQMIEVEVTRDMDVVRCQRVVGNLETGIMRFGGFMCKVGQFYCSAESGERASDGVIKVRDAKLSTCEYLMEDHEHYSIFCGEATLIPSDVELIKIGGAKKGVGKYNFDHGEHSMWATDCQLRFWDVPVAWVPIMYKPEDSGNGICEFVAGHETSLGYFIKLSKGFTLWNDPNVTGKAFLDFYSKRGIGWGGQLDMNMENSKTEFFGYGIVDQDPYAFYDTKSGGGDFVKNERRLKNPNARYDIRLSHLNHITPRMDFRGHIELLSDVNFLHDYFKERADNDPQPATFASLEYQFDHLSTAVIVRPRVNDFYSVVQQLPEIRLDIQRQELFKNIYYQSETSFSYLYMNWRDYDRPRLNGNRIDPKNYDTFRFDTLHMFYYPFEIDWLNINPRAGIRFTNYSKSSRRSVSQENLQAMFIVDNPDSDPDVDVYNYNHGGGNKFRVAGEIGLEMSAKFHRTWQDVKSPFWELDGLRHVAQPYFNYTFLPPPTVKRSKLFYFDDIDRIDTQNFARFGLRNRLQTRRGAMGREFIYEWASMENYIDFHFNKEKNFSNLGDFGTIFKFNPFPDLSVTSELLISGGTGKQRRDNRDEFDNNTGTEEYGNEYKKREGIDTSFINKWRTQIDYQILEDLKIYGGYNFQDNYRQRSVYSMGSSLTDITSGSSFERSYRRFNELYGGIDFPIPFDDKTHCSLNAAYDVDAQYLRRVGLSIVRDLHCWQAAIELAQERDRNYTGGQQTRNSVMFSLYLTAAPSVGIKLRHKP